MTKLVVAALLLAVLTTGVYSVTYSDVENAIEANRLTTFRLMAIAGDVDLSKPSQIVTAFLPAEDGWSALTTALGMTLPQILKDKAVSRAIVNYHLIPGRIVRTTDVPKDMTKTLVQLTAFNNQALLLGRDVAENKTFFYVRGDVNQAIVDKTKHDLYTIRGIVHLVNSALVPPPKLVLGPAPEPKPKPALDVYTFLAQQPELSNLTALINAAGMKGYLSIKALRLTVFAPTNAAVAKGAKQLGLNVALLLRRPRAYLAPLVSALIVDQMLAPTKMADLETFNTHASTTILVRNTNGTIIINSIGANRTPRATAKVVSKPMYIDPSVVYVVDGLLLA